MKNFWRGINVIQVATFILIVVVIIISAVACGSPRNEVAEQVVQGAVEGVEFDDPEDAQMLADIRMTFPYSQNFSESDLVEITVAACDDMTNGGWTFQLLVDEVPSYAETDEDIELALGLLGAAVVYKCPEFTDQMEAYVNG